MSRRGGCWFGKRCLAGGLGSGDALGRGGGLEVVEGFEGTKEHAIGGIDAPLDASKGIEGGVESVAERGIALDGRVDEFGAGEVLVEDVDAVIPELRFDTAQASLDPLGGDEGVDERKLKGIGWAAVKGTGWEVPPAGA